MARIAYILLCHKDPDAIIKQAKRLTAVGDFMSIHFDARADAGDYRRIREALAGNDNVTFASRVKCGWGEWSLVQATINAVSAAEAAFPKATHFYMLSGDCMAIKSAPYAHEFLDGRDVDYIESFDFFESDWIKTGLKGERLYYRYPINERKHKALFYWVLNFQKRFGLKRKIPADIQVMIGSQWWCLRRRTVEWVLDFVKNRREVVQFFKTTWIPDETFFQTVVRHLVPEPEIDTRTLTFLMFSDYGMPVTFFNDQYDLLLSQDFLFARKISPEALELKRKLGDLYASDKTDFVVSNEGRSLYKFLTSRGREGRRFAPRFWERESTLGRERELLILICKKWHVAKRLLKSAKSVTKLNGADFLFDEDQSQLPDLGGIQSSLEKRTRHRRAMMRMLFDYHDTNRMMICLDPNNMSLLKDFYSDRCTTKILEIDCEYDDDYLIGHAMRAGLAGDNTTEDSLVQLIPTVRNDFAHESDMLRDENFPHYYRISESGNDDENTMAISAFLELPEEKARKIATTKDLFG